MRHNLSVVIQTSHKVTKHLVQFSFGHMTMFYVAKCKFIFSTSSFKIAEIFFYFLMCKEVSDTKLAVTKGITDKYVCFFYSLILTHRINTMWRNFRDSA